MKYKKVKKLVPWCETCKKEIRGNGSELSHYRCDCGEWKFDTEKFDYILEKKE